MFPFLAVEDVVHVLKENCASEEVKLSMLCLFCLLLHLKVL